MNDPLTLDLFARRHDEAIENLRNSEIRRANPIPAARKSDPPTSHAAAQLASLNAGTLRMLALRLLAEQPLTDFQLATLAGSQQTSIGVRRHELVKLGFVCPLMKGIKRVTRPSPSGAQAQVWQVTPEGIQYLREAK